MDTAARHKCVYKGCKNDDRIKNNISFFKFPVSNENRTKQWQKNCGNESIAATCETSELKRKVICELHFLPRDIRKNNKRKILTNTAVPIRYSKKDSEQVPSFLAPSTSSCIESSVGEHFRTYSRKHSDPDSEITTSFKNIPNKLATKPSHNSPSPNSGCGSKVSERPSEQLKTCTYKRSHVNRPKKKRTSFSVDALLGNLLINRSRFVKTFIKMQLFYKRNNTQWDKDEQQLALSLYYKSPSAYKFMLYSFKFVLPSITSIQKWLKVSNLNTKLVNKLAVKTKRKKKTMSNEEKF